jgi:ectoine hydroxylase-related dioxygenase (phytanoyl-CoA dioxygenase family)
MSQLEVAPPEVSDEQRRQLDEQGFFITPVLFDEATIAAVRGEFERLWQHHIDQTIKGGGDDLAVRQARERAFFACLETRSDICRDFCMHPVFRSLCIQLLGPDADMTWNQAIVKPPGVGDNAFAWHQDMWYATHGDYVKDTNPDIFNAIETGITVWVAISPTTVENGTLWVLPGRHKEGLFPHVWSESRREWQGQFDTSAAVPAVLEPGQMLVFRKYLPHGSGANVSDNTRMAYQIGYSVPGLKTAPSPFIVPLIRNGKLATT